MSCEKITTNEHIMPTYNRFPVRIVKGEGHYLYGDDDTKYLDYTSGIATCNVGHRPKSVQEKVTEQIETLWHCSNLFHIPTQEKLADQLTQLTCFDQVFFSNSGAEANEAAIKLARRYHQKVKQTDREEIVTFSQSFHGRTLATLSATGQEKIQDGFLPLMPGFSYLPYNDSEALNQLIERQPAAVMLELVQGEGGVIPVEKAWLEKLIKLCDEHDILIIVDEIQTGVGRTGTLYFYQQFDFEPDILTSAKGLASGLPIGATLAKSEVAEAFSAGTHGSTFGGNPIVTSGALATLDLITKELDLSQIRDQMALFKQKLEHLAQRKNEILTVRGAGYLLGLETTKKAIDIVHAVRENDHILILVAGPQVVRILPPLTTTEEEMDRVIAALDRHLN
ncbi:acetylornithine aminotransferase apoenzyme [Pelagirhabdus alkalitolerans]|uniref:Acetylornithine aminotransferase apoenzyme n=1 Tax=Pelagirhabdus alkalitolerans TaxID=1612202 RepID=A0A1G6GKP0_9BACI|nr:aspartate aminotransferase family protein [Pelagirhabdus alkalitolerans]SDB82413.1 acetylornithine aminotransferase apoenzyme [Pelagirhabdus alkalitolerans]